MGGQEEGGAHQKASGEGQQGEADERRDSLAPTGHRITDRRDLRPDGEVIEPVRATLDLDLPPDASGSCQSACQPRFDGRGAEGG